MYYKFIIYAIHHINNYRISSRICNIHVSINTRIVNSLIGSDNTVSPIDCCDYIDMKPGMLPLETVLEKQLSL